MKIIVSSGDPNGIGLEIFAKALFFLENKPDFDDVEISLAGSAKVCAEYFEKIAVDFDLSDSDLIIAGRQIPIIDVGEAKITLGEETREGGEFAARCLETAAEATFKKEFDAMVTAPISKAATHLAGRTYPGHTEAIARICGVEEPLMILCSESVRVALITAHAPISKVPKLITPELIKKKFEIFYRSLETDFGIDYPSVAVLGLNPHSGESGDIGREEIRVYEPAISDLRARNINVEGPFPADGFFARSEQNRFDGILASYHDQGLVPLKMLAAGAGVNFTAGLPIVRTSPDHGTAFAIAGKNAASEKSAVAAFEAAVKIARNRLRRKN